MILHQRGSIVINNTTVINNYVALNRVHNSAKAADVQNITIIKQTHNLPRGASFGLHLTLNLT